MRCAACSSWPVARGDGLREPLPVLLQRIAERLRQPLQHGAIATRHFGQRLPQVSKD